MLEISMEILYSHASPRLILSKGLVKQMEIFVYHAVIQMPHYVFFWNDIDNGILHSHEISILN